MNFIIINCKLCKFTAKLCNAGMSRNDNGWLCICKQYSCVYVSNGSFESETIRFGNFYITYLPEYKTASVVSVENGQKKIIDSFDMHELTYEQATQWAQKLKLYTTFQ